MDVEQVLQKSWDLERKLRRGDILIGNRAEVKIFGASDGWLSDVS